MKASEIRDRSNEELVELQKELGDKLVGLRVETATQRQRNTSQLGQVRRDLARVKTIMRERAAGVGSQEN